MKFKCFIILMLFLFINILFAYERKEQTNFGDKPYTRPVQSIFYEYGFDDGLQNWTTSDHTGGEVKWHLTNTTGIVNQNYGGYSWWMGDMHIGSGVGGYFSDVYTYLQSPMVTVNLSNMNLTFDMKLNCESPEVSLPYDGWDGAVVMIARYNSNPSLMHFSPLVPITPNYNFTNGYCWEYNEVGTNIPGWGGDSRSFDGATSDGWVNAKFSLSDYVGEDVVLRWYFGADEASDTFDNANWFGLIIDNIRISENNYIFTSQVDTQGFTTFTNRTDNEKIGDLWHITAHNKATSPPNVMICQTESGTILPSLNNVLISPVITLPNDGTIIADFMIGGKLKLSQPVDMFTWSVYHDLSGEYRWYDMHNPYSTGGFYVNIFNENIMESFLEKTQIDGDISLLAGKQVQFRWELKTSKAVHSTEKGIWVDDFVIYHTPFLPEPRDLSINVNNQRVTLKWVHPTQPGNVEEGWIQHCDEIVNDAISIGYNVVPPYSLGCATRFSPLHLIMQNATNGYISKVAFIVGDALPKYKIKIYSGGGSVTLPGELIYTSEDISFSISEIEDQLDGNWSIYDLPEAIKIEANKEIRILIEAYYDVKPDIENHEGYTFITSEKNLPGYGNIMLYPQGNWGLLAPEYSNNFLIKAYIVDEEGLPISNRITRDLVQPDNFYVYRKIINASSSSWERIATVNGNTTTYIDNNPQRRAINQYYVTANYNNDSSDPSNIVEKLIISSGDQAIRYDNGHANTFLEIPSGEQTNLFAPVPNSSGEKYKLRILEFYVVPPALSTTVKVFAENATGYGAERWSQSLTYSGVGGYQIKDGWNYIFLPDIAALEFNNGTKFYLGFRNTESGATIGIDTTSPIGKSFTRATPSPMNPQPFQVFNTGTFLIRAYVQSDVTSNLDLVLPYQSLTAQNYPNPFNPSTTIKFTINNAQNTTLEIFNIKGQKIKTLVNDFLEIGEHSFIWNGNDNNDNQVSSGIYLYKITTDNDVILNKMLLMK